MKTMILVLIALGLSACGGALEYSSSEKSDCDLVYSAFEQKLTNLTVGVSPQSDIEVILGKPSNKYPLQTSAYTYWDEYRYRLITPKGKYCGEYRIIASAKVDLIQDMKVYR